MCRSKIFSSFLFFVFLLGCSFSQAQVSQVKKVKASATRKNFSQFHMGYQVWQEAIDVKSAATESEMLTSLHGFRMGYSLHRPFNKVRWVAVYGFDLGFGVAKGAASSPLTDEVEDQNWFSGTFNPGLMYRSTSKSEIGLFVPITYRMIQWKVAEPFDPEKDSSFSAGITAAYVTRFNLRSSLMFTLTHQQLWTATIWGVGYQIDFR